MLIVQHHAQRHFLTPATLLLVTNVTNVSEHSQKHPCLDSSLPIVLIRHDNSNTPDTWWEWSNSPGHSISGYIKDLSDIACEVQKACPPHPPTGFFWAPDDIMYMTNSINRSLAPMLGTWRAGILPENVLDGIEPCNI